MNPNHLEQYRLQVPPVLDIAFESRFEYMLQHTFFIDIQILVSCTAFHITHFKTRIPQSNIGLGRAYFL